MACRVAENQPLSLLRRDLGVGSQCHSLRRDCLKDLARLDTGYALGAPGAALGYCQALFHSQNDARRHTEYVRACLKTIGAPWPSSHELFWGYKGDQPTSAYISKAVQPLAGTGRVPILITGLDPGEQEKDIQEVLSTLPEVARGETILVRLVLKGRKSIESISRITQQLVQRAQQEATMPTWWPLVQGDISANEWRVLRELSGTNWRYLNVAINPFTSGEALEEIWEQITVAQIPIGLAEGILNDGTIKLAAGVKIMGAGEHAGYDLYKFAESLNGLRAAPTLIVLGPAAPAWPEDWNLKRVSKIIPVLRESVELFWKDLPKKRREAVWNMES